MGEKHAKDVENGDHGKSKEDRFPAIVIVIIIAEFCERFSYSGMKAFLTLYLKSKLMYSDDEATEIYHVFSTLIYFFPILGAITADNYLGKFRTILYMMFVYAAGNMVIALTAIPQLAMPGRICTMLGLLLIGIGAGGIKPCVAAFGGDQFEVPRQEKQLAVYFMVLYFTLCFGALIAKTVSPILRSEIHCFGDKDCYSIAFGAPGIIMIASIVIFVAAKKYYIVKKPAGNIVLDVIKCIALGIKNKVKLGSRGVDATHWLDSTENEYDRTFITDIKKTLSILMLYIPIPAFWALLDQMGSRWTLQATRMNGDFGFFTVKPDQMQVLAPIIILVIIPLFQKVLYPCFEKFNIMKNPLHKLTLGGVLAGISFIVSGCIELHLQTTYPQLPQQNFSQMRIFNGYPCALRINNTLDNITATIAPYSVYVNKNIRVSDKRNISLDMESECREMVRNWFLMEENEALSFYLSDSGNVRYKDEVSKSRSGYPLVRFIVNGLAENNSRTVLYNERRQDNEVFIDNGVSTLHEVFPSIYSILVDNRTIDGNFQLKSGGVYAIMLSKSNSDNYIYQVIVITEPNAITMALLLPQFIIISIAEVFFAITGTEFSFKEAPQSMKSVMQASWLLMEALGNILIIVVTRLAVSCSQATQSFIYTGIIFVAMIIFYFLAENYKFSSETMTRKKPTPDAKNNRRNSAVLYLQVKQCEEFIDH